MWLFDGNLLVALTIDTHGFHQRAQHWFDSQVEPFATCTITVHCCASTCRLRKTQARPLRGPSLKRFTLWRTIFLGRWLLLYGSGLRQYIRLKASYRCVVGGTRSSAQCATRNS